MAVCVSWTLHFPQEDCAPLMIRTSNPEESQVAETGRTKPLSGQWGHDKWGYSCHSLDPSQLILPLEHIWGLRFNGVHPKG